MTFDEWWQKERSTLTAVNPSAKDGAIRAWNYRGEKTRTLQARIEALEKAATTAVADYTRWVLPQYGAVDGLDELAALLQEPTK